MIQWERFTLSLMSTKNVCKLFIITKSFAVCLVDCQSFSLNMTAMAVISILWGDTNSTFLKYTFFGLLALLTEQLKTCQETGWEGSDKQQRAPSRDSNLGPLQRGQSLCTWDTCSIHWAKQRPLIALFCNQKHKFSLWNLARYKLVETRVRAGEKSCSLPGGTAGKI